MAVEWDDERKEYVEVIKIANLHELGIDGGSGGGGTVQWNNVMNKPQKFPPTDHNHDDRYNTKEDVQAIVDWVNTQMQEEKGKVAVTSDDTPDFLENKVDNITLAVQNKELKVMGIDGLRVEVPVINSALEGTEANLQLQINDIKTLLESISGGMKFKDIAETRAEIDGWENKENGGVAVVLTDETKNNGRSMYVYSDDLGMWRYLGTFTFTTKFTTLEDTPSGYENGKYLKSTNSGIVYSDIDYQDLVNKPQSSITQIDDAVAKKHEHNNADSLAKLGVNSDGELTINGVVYAPKTKIPVKHRLYARRTGTEQTLTAGTTCVFNAKYVGEGIPYNTSTGVFTLEAGKTYRVFVTASIKTDGYVIMRLVSASGNAVTADNNQAIWMSVNPSNSNWKEASAGPLLAYITPATTQGFKIIASSVNGTTGLRPGHCALEITEI